jgi:four helix bundle protein
MPTGCRRRRVTSFNPAILQSCNRAIEDREILKIYYFYCSNLNRAKIGTIKNFEDLNVWKLSRELVNLVYLDFTKCRDFTFRDQITRAGISIMNNISEGFCRNSDREFRQFLNFSKGSSGEVKNMYYLAEDLKYVDIDKASDRRDRCQKIINSLGGFMKYLDTKK